MEEMREDLAKIVTESKTKYNDNTEHNFALPGELTVRITLSEYRMLVCAKSQYKAEETRLTREKIERDRIIETLKKANESLKEKLLAVKEG